ncbi:hypothetical protein F5Y04DRAFT_282741 [Hypomontagnella monticulosa]|nr:hypothetical protein F5Y04DRAFT_282741 [Hypomontagnella monticulosa]
MAPLIETSWSSSTVADESFKSSSRIGLFERAVLDVIENSKWSSKDKEKNPFLAELIKAGDRYQAAKTDDDDLGSDTSLEKLREFIQQLETQKKASRGYRILHRLSPFLESLHNLMKICESATQEAPFGVGIAFSGARIVLQLAFDVHSQFETVLEALERIGANLECYRLLAQYNTSPELERVLVSSYKNIIQFWLKASQTLSQGPLKQLTRALTTPLHAVIKQACDALSEDSRAVHHLAQAIENVQSQNDRDQRSTESEKKRRDDIATWIRGQENLDANPDLEDQLQRRQDGTCSWILEDQRFKDWRDANTSATMWYNAPPGSGKSVLASSVIQHLKDRRANIAMYFFSFNSLTRRCGINGLRSLALQLLAMTELLPDRFTETYEQRKLFSPTLDSYDVARNLIHQLLTPMDEVYLVIDGLDESADEALLLAVLRSLVQAKVYATVKWFITSRDHPPSIRKTMENMGAIEIRPGSDVISSDIQKYVAATMTCPGCFADWADENEVNFLYARFVCETLRYEGLTRVADIERVLSTFPKDLDSYYVRSLEKIAEYTEVEQELVRRVFVILIGAAQSVSLRELVDALSIEPGARDYDKNNRVLDDELIGRLCGPILAFERKSSSLDPKVKFYHKTVKDFLLQNPDTIKNIGEPIRKYFITTRDADRELGLQCVTYLKYDRYTEYIDIPLLLADTPKEHAFLRYAAAFWWKHLEEVVPTPDMIAQVAEFLKSRAFWNCLCVQSRIAPYLFGRYTHTKTNKFVMGFRGAQWNGEDSFGIPLPTWFSGQSSECMMLDQTLCHFAEEWREVIITCPDGVDLCTALRPSTHSCQLKPLSKSKAMRAEHLKGLPDMDDLSHVRLLSTALVGKRLSVDVLYGKRNSKPGEMQRLRAMVLPSKTPSVSLVHLPSNSQPSEGCVLTWDQDVVETWNVDQHTLDMSRKSAEPSKPFKAPPYVHEHTKEKGEGRWWIWGADTTPISVIGTSVRIIHASWREKAVIPSACSEQEKDDADSDNDSEWSESESESESSDDHESTDSDEEDESATTSVTDFESKNSENGSHHCLIFLRPDGQPFWSRPWTNPHGRVEKIGWAAHPKRPLLAFTNTALQLELIDLEKGTQSTKHLPEPVGFHAEPLAITRELHFSACGNYLYGLSVSFINKPVGTDCYVILSTYNINYEGDSDETFLRERQPIQCTYKFADRLIDLAPKLTLTHWDDDCLLIALPPLTCDPKILAINLPKGAETPSGADSTPIRTLEKQIYFPASTPRRDARLLFKQSSEGKDDYIYLALGAFSPPSPPPTDNKTNTLATPSQASPPVFLQWRVSQADGWRAWDPEVDEESADWKRKTPISMTLRGNFVDSEKSVSVPIRSGLNWTRKGHLSCW